jgi:hypothetical protein
VAQWVIEHLHTKYEALSSNPITAKDKKGTAVIQPKARHLLFVFVWLFHMKYTGYRAARVLQIWKSE